VSVRFRVDLYSVSIRVLVSSFGSAQLYQPFLIGPAANKKKSQIIHFRFLFFYITEKYVFSISKNIEMISIKDSVIVVPPYF
jgi:hypothetical protein